jgi:catechol 2,3-dioxygenase-like lactoylglutathione lyase family enzyme
MARGAADGQDRWMARFHDIVVDSAHPAGVARFWAAALDGYAVAPYDEAELARLREHGIAGPEDDPTVLVEPRDRGPRLWFQLVPEPRRVKNRVHLDLLAADVEAEIVRLIALGATVLARHEKHTVLADPEGNEFCVAQG